MAEPMSEAVAEVPPGLGLTDASRCPAHPLEVPVATPLVTEARKKAGISRACWKCPSGAMRIIRTWLYGDDWRCPVCGSCSYVVPVRRGIPVDHDQGIWTIHHHNRIMNELAGHEEDAQR